MTAGLSTTPPPTTEPWAPRGHPVRIAGVTLLVAVLLCLGAITSGAITPDVGLAATQWMVPPPSTYPIDSTMDVLLTSHRSLEVDIDSVGESLPGLRLVSVERRDDDGGLHPFAPASLARGDAETIVHLTYRVTDCKAIPKGHVGLRLRVRTGTGLHRDLHRRLVLTARPDAPSMRSYSGRYDPYDEPWQITLSRSVCGW